MLALTEHSVSGVILCLEHTKQSQKKNRSKKFAERYEISSSVVITCRFQSMKLSKKFRSKEGKENKRMSELRC